MFAQTLGMHIDIYMESQYTWTLNLGEMPATLSDMMSIIGSSI